MSPTQIRELEEKLNDPKNIPILLQIGQMLESQEDPAKITNFILEKFYVK